MTALHTTSHPLRLPRTARAALLGLALFSTAAAGSATAAVQVTDVTQTPATAQVTDATQSTATTQVANAQASNGTAESDAHSGSAEPAAQAGRAATGATLSLSASRWDYKNAEFFKRISEYFTGEENTGYRVILRTDPQQRTGLYFQSRLSTPLRDLPQGAKLRVSFVNPEQADTTTTHTFAIPAALRDSGNAQLWLGFTGADAPPADTPPVAWQICVVDAEGNTLAQTHSFLWSPRDEKNLPDHARSSRHQ